MIALTATLPARAADLSVKAPAVAAAVPGSWTGFYLGVHAGSAATSSTWGEGTGVLEGSTVDAVAWSADGAAPVVGVQAGYNYQVGQVVMGVELDASAGQMNAFSRCLGDFNSICTNSADWMGTLTARLGYAFGNVLVYGKAGGAMTDSSVTVSSSSFSG
ncbi:MAG: hypothetical protein B7Y84_15065, partial [Azorhizobium sp. 32-67-21]